MKFRAKPLGCYDYRNRNVAKLRLQDFLSSAQASGIISKGSLPPNKQEDVTRMFMAALYPTP
jgi:hypothetical protein